MALLHRKAEAGETESVEQPPASEPTLRTADVIDLTEFLERSLKGNAASAGVAAAPPNASA